MKQKRKRVSDVLRVGPCVGEYLLTQLLPWYGLEPICVNGIETNILVHEENFPARGTDKLNYRYHKDTAMPSRRPYFRNICDGARNKTPRKSRVGPMIARHANLLVPGVCTASKDSGIPKFSGLLGFAKQQVRSFVVFPKQA